MTLGGGLRRPLLMAFLVLLAVQCLTVLRLYDFSAQGLWNGQVYGSAVHQYIEGGNSLSAIDPTKFPSFADGQPKQTFIQTVAAYIVLFAGVRQLTGWSDAQVAGAILFFGYLAASWFLFLLCHRAHRLSWQSSLFAAIAFLVLMPAGIIHRTQIHPEPLVTALTAAFVYWHLMGRHRLAAASAFIAMMSKGSFFPVIVILGFTELMRAIGGEGDRAARARTLALYGAAAVAGAFLPRLIAPPNYPPFFLTWRAIEIIFEMNDGTAWGYAFYNFDAWTVPFLLQIRSLSRESRREIFLLFLVCLTSLAFVTDWWRNWFATGFVFVLPIAARFFSERIRPALGPELELQALLLVTLPTALHTWHTMQRYPFEELAAATAGLAALLIVAARLRQRSSAESPSRALAGTS